MQDQRAWGYWLTVGIVVCVGGSLSVSLSGQASSSRAPGAVPVAKAQCGPGDRPESGLQGQTTLAERFSPPHEYNCNLELVGRFPGVGGSWHMAEFEDCAYYSQALNPMENRGTVVLDVSDPRQPKAVTYLSSTRAILASNESLEVNKARKLLVAADWANWGDDVAGGTFEVWDVSDCRRPVLKGSTELRDMVAHAGNMPLDGMTYYSGNHPGNGAPASEAAVMAIDVSDPSKPRVLARWDRPARDWTPHAVGVREDGNRVYHATFLQDNPKLTILDSSDIQARKPNAGFRVITTFTLPGYTYGQFALPTRIGGRSYVIYSAVRPVAPSGSPLACSTMGSPWIIDVSDETNPQTVSIPTLEANDPTNCAKVANDPVFAGYGNTYCSTDNNQNAKMLACAFAEGGVRVFDIRDPARPREIAYYKPPAWRTQVRAASFYGFFGSGVTQPAVQKSRQAAIDAGTHKPATNDHTTDAVLMPVFRNNATEIWFVSADGGFHVVRFSDRIKAAEEALFE